MNKRTMTLTLTLTLAATGLVTAAAAAQDEASDTPIRIGLEAPLSGNLSAIGEGMLGGAELAAARLNEAGGVLGRDIEIVPIDDAGDADIGIAAATAAIEAGLDGVVGPYNSGVGIETLPLYIEAGLVPIRLTSDASTSGLGYTLQPMTYEIVPVVASALTDWLAAERIAILYDASENYTTTIAETLRTDLESAGVEIVAFETVEPGQDDYTELVLSVAELAPDAVYAAAYVAEGGRIAKAMNETGTDAACLADYGSYERSYVEFAGLEAAQACPVVGVPAPEDFPGSDELVVAYQETIGSQPGIWSPYTYDSVMLLADGMSAAGSLDADAIDKALANLEGWTGWTGEVELDPVTGDRVPATVVIVNVDDDGELHVNTDWARAVGAPYGSTE